MNKLQSIFFLSLLVASSQALANRPAEDDPTPDQAPAQQPQSSIPAPESSEPDNIPEAPEVTTHQQSGDIIEVQPTEQKPQVVLIDFPRRGMDMSKVLNEMGEPSIRHPAVGQPPITRWDYPDRTVFFEYSHVIHVVAK